jgi:hypothetical protein
LDLSVIIVSYKGRDTLEICLESLESFKCERFSLEVIVVDNNSADGALERIEKRFSMFRFVHNKVNGGFANGCNLGAGISSGDVLLFLNPDTVVMESEAEKLYNSVKDNPGYFIVSCRQVREDGKETKVTGKFPGLFRKKKASGSSLGKDADAVKVNDSIFFPDWVSGSVMSIRRDVFSRLNGFDEDFWMYSEDVDICRRAWDMGGRVACFRDITVQHNHGGSTRADAAITAISKSEVQISRQLYIHKHLRGAEKLIMHSLRIADNIFIGFIEAVAGLVLFFVPGLHIRATIFILLIRYYFGSVIKGSWISPRSVNSNSE